MFNLDGPRQGMSGLWGAWPASKHTVSSSPLPPPPKGEPNVELLVTKELTEAPSWKVAVFDEMAGPRRVYRRILSAVSPGSSGNPSSHT